jgi:hypothetical protein
VTDYRLLRNKQTSKVILLGTKDLNLNGFKIAAKWYRIISVGSSDDLDIDVLLNYKIWPLTKRNRWWKWSENLAEVFLDKKCKYKLQYCYAPLRFFQIFRLIAGIPPECKTWIEVDLSLSYQAEFRLPGWIGAEKSPEFRA